MIDILDKHIDAQIETYKSNRYENSDSKGMSHIRRLLKGDYNENHKSVLGSNQKDCKDIEHWRYKKVPTVSVNATKVKFEIEKLKKEWHI